MAKKRLRKTVDFALIMRLRPCDAWPSFKVKAKVPKRVLLTNVLQDSSIPEEDRIWLAMHSEFLTDKEMRLFACDCAERAMKTEEDPDKACSHAIGVARSFAQGTATRKDLDDAAEMIRVSTPARWAAWDTAALKARDAAKDAAVDARVAIVSAFTDAEFEKVSKERPYGPTDDGIEGVRKAELERQLAAIIVMLEDR